MRRRILLIVLVLLIALIPTGVSAQDTGNETDDEVLVRVNGSDQVAESEQVNVVVIVEGNVEVAGTVEDVLVVVNGDATVSGQVNGEVFMFDGLLTLEDGSQVDGDVVLAGDAEISQQQGSTVTGEVREETWEFDMDNDLSWTVGILYVVSWLGTTVFLVLGALLFAGIGGRQLWSSAACMTGRPGRTILSSILFWIIASVIVLILFFTLFGIPLALLLLAIIWAVWVLGYVVAGTRIGALVVGRSTDLEVNHPYLPALVGVLILQIISLIIATGAFIAAAGSSFDDSGVVGALVGIATAVIGFLMALLGFLGVGALVYRAWLAWTSTGRQEGLAGDEPI